MFYQKQMFQADAIAAEISFVGDGFEYPQIFVDENGKAGYRYSFDYQPQTVPIHDIREYSGDYTLSNDGIAFVTHHPGGLDLDQVPEHPTRYNSEVEDLLRQHANAEEVHVFDHTIRVDDPKSDRRKPVRHAHADYTAASGPKRLVDLLDQETAARWQKGRYGIVNLWRPINGPVETSPLAFAEPGSLESGDLVRTDLIYPDRFGEIYELKHSPGQRWIYFARQDVDDVTLFTTFDSGSGADQRIAPHTAFDLPGQTAASRPRISLESRALVLFSGARIVL